MSYGRMGMLAIAVLPVFHALQMLDATAHSSTPFQAGHKGASVYIGAMVRSERVYRFSLGFNLLGLSYDQRRDLQRLETTHANGTMGKGEVCAEIPVNLRIVRLENNDTVRVLEATVTEECRGMSSDTRMSMTVATVDLIPGDYRVRIEAMGNLEAVSGIPILFEMYPA